MVEATEVLEYLKDYRSTKEIREKFQLSNSGFYHLIKWLLKGKYIDKCKGTDMGEKSSKIGLSGELKNKQNVTWLYKAR